ncbi:MAG: hypothetical protein IJS59_00770 [Bacteroidaceae bacterium]|nr:hypothetical protein [Bacteroidaceae bacterium]
MKTKILFTALAWLLAMGHAVADGFVIPDVTVPQGGTAELTVGYTFTSTTDKVGFTLALGLPDGISLAKDADGDLLYTKDATSIDKLNIISAGEGNIGGQPANENATIKGTSGTLLALTLVADAAIEAGTTFTVPVTKATFQQRVDGAVTDINLEDFTFSITIGEPDDGYIKFNEASSALPQYTAGAKGNVRMTRTIRGGQWSTIVLPFTLTKTKAEAAFGSDVQLAEFAGFEVDYGDDDENVTPLGITINFSEYTMSARKSMTGGKPYLIKTSQDVTSFEAEDVTLTDAVADVTRSDDYDTEGRFTASLVTTVVPADGLFLSGNKFYYSTGKTAIKAFRGWFELGAVLDKATDFGVKMAFVIDGIETSIDELQGHQEVNGKASVGKCFDLSGRRVAAPGQKGVYIVDGRKVAVN